MKKLLAFVAVLVICLSVSGQEVTYTILSSENSEIKLYPNHLGSSIKSIIPGTVSKTNYRLIQKTEKSKSSYIFVEFVNILDKYLVSYETDMVTPGVWAMKTYSFEDIYDACKRQNAIYFEGTLLGMKIEIYQRPDNFNDVIVIDGIESMSPIKIKIFESNSAQALADALNRAKNDSIQAAQLAAKDSIEKAERLLKDKEVIENLVVAGAELGLSREVVEESITKHDEYYIAYLSKTQRLDNKKSGEIFARFNREEVKKYYLNYTVEQLNFLSRGHSKSLSRYEL